MRKTKKNINQSGVIGKKTIVENELKYRKNTQQGIKAKYLPIIGTLRRPQKVGIVYLNIDTKKGGGLTSCSLLNSTDFYTTNGASIAVYQTKEDWTDSTMTLVTHSKTHVLAVCAATI